MRALDAAHIVQLLRAVELIFVLWLIVAFCISGLTQPQVSGKSCIVRGLAIKGLERVKIADMAAAFEKYGTVTNVKFMDDRNADAIVEFQRIGEAAEAVSHLHGTKLKNRTIEVQLGDRFMPKQSAPGSLLPVVASKPTSSGSSGGGGRSTPGLSVEPKSAVSSRDRSRSDKVKQEPARKVKDEGVIKVKEDSVTGDRPPVKEERPAGAKASRQKAKAKQTQAVEAAPKRQQVVESESEQEEDESLSDETDDDDDYDGDDGVAPQEQAVR